jgi:hypothetical protein
MRNSVAVILAIRAASPTRWLRAFLGEFFVFHRQESLGLAPRNRQSGMDGCAQWHARKNLLHEVQDTLSKAWFLTGIPERTELAKRDIPITGVRNGRSLADDVPAARVESHWRRFPLRNVARVWRHKLLRRQISRTSGN